MPLLCLILGTISSLLLFVLLLLKLLEPSILGFLDSIRSSLLDLALLICLFLDHILDFGFLVLDLGLLVLNLVMGLLFHLLGLKVAVGARLPWRALRPTLSFASALSNSAGGASGALLADALWSRWSLWACRWSSDTAGRNKSVRGDQRRSGVHECSLAHGKRS